MDFFSCACLLSVAADQIKAIGFPQTLRVINISAEQMQNTADPLSRSEKTLGVVFFFAFAALAVHPEEFCLKESDADKTQQVLKQPSRHSCSSDAGKWPDHVTPSAATGEA